MALKFLNKKGWHTGSLRNIENVWKAEQKHDAEQKKLEELKKQIEEERDRFEFRQLQEQAGLVPKQERLEFLYDSGLAVGKSSSDGFKALETPKAETESSDLAKDVPGALFQDKPQSANDAWRKLHSDPLLMIRQREQEALARIKNNPVRMEMIRKSVEGKNKHEGKHKKKEHKKHRKKTKHEKQGRSDSESASSSEEDRRERKRPDGRPPRPDSGRASENHRAWTDRTSRRDTPTRPPTEEKAARQRDVRHDTELHEKRSGKTMHGKETRLDPEAALSSEEERRERKRMEGRPPRSDPRRGPELYHPRTDSSSSHHTTPNKDQTTTRLSAEEKAARLREMQLDAEVHEQQRYRRLKKASEDDAREASQANSSGGRNFLEAAHKSIYGTEKGGSSSIEESVRRRKYYSQGGSEARDGNAFRR